MSESQKSMLQQIAHQAMIDRGLEPDFPREALQQAEGIEAAAADASLKDLRQLLWCSIDNDDSLDLDQLTVAEELTGGDVRVMVAVADVDALVPKGTPLDEHAKKNTTSVYTAAQIFPMLPEKLSTNLTSLNQDVDRVAMVMDLRVSSDGSVKEGDVYRAIVRNKAKLAYSSTGAWLEDKGPMPNLVRAVPGLDQNLKLQDRIAQAMREQRHEHGALDLESIEPHAVLRDGQVVDLKLEPPNHAKQLIEDFMIGANGATALFLEKRKLSSMRRVVRSPERWDRIVAIAKEHGTDLPGEPDSVALEQFLQKSRKADPVRFPDLSLAIVKAMGAGEYVLERPGETSIGHFGLAVKDYSHSTAPNRRYPDLITHRLIKAAIAGQPAPYSDDEISALAEHCTAQEDAANKVERQVRKSAAASLLQSHIGERFDGLITGASEKGTFVRVFHPPVEGKIVHGGTGLDVGQKVRVKLIGANVERGFIDFVATH